MMAALICLLGLMASGTAVFMLCTAANEALHGHAREAVVPTLLGLMFVACAGMLFLAGWCA